VDPHPAFLSPRRLGGGHKDEVAVSNWLSGRNEPNMRNLLRLSTALRTDPAAAKTEREAPGFVPICANSS